MRFSRQGYWSGLPFPSPGDLPNPGIEPRSPALQEDSLLSELQGKPLYFFEPLFLEGGKTTGVGCHSLLQEIFPTQELNSGLPHFGTHFTFWATREVNIGINICNLGLHKTSDETSKAQLTKGKTDELDSSKLKSLCCFEWHHQENKNDSTYIFTNYLYSKGFVCRIYKELQQLNNGKINSPILKWLKDLNRYFSKEDIQMATKESWNNAQ